MRCSLPSAVSFFMPWIISSIARTENIRVNEFALGEIYDSTLWISASMRLDANAFAGSASSSCGMSTAASA